ncbi:AGE family epimerase/isomerase [Caulobacter sp. DWR3-1-2]|uniref:AGE family epimerase/isomerase n=1 Tax=Caulobacter sp. DWR3-1-2 TaxID=2804647 RepID=UPI003CEA34F0
MREFFNDDWTPAAGEDGTLFEPGRQFEWAWLLARYGLLRQDDRALAAARALYANGRKGIGPRPPVALDAMNDDMTIRSPRARLWPQTEWLKSSLILAKISAGGERHLYLEDAATALRALRLYLTDDGLWRDKRFPNGTFLDEPAPASSFYHIIAAFDPLSRTFKALDLGDGRKLTLGSDWRRKEPAGVQAGDACAQPAQPSNGPTTAGAARGRRRRGSIRDIALRPDDPALIGASYDSRSVRPRLWKRAPRVASTVSRPACRVDRFGAAKARAAMAGRSTAARRSLAPERPGTGALPREAGSQGVSPRPTSHGLCWFFPPEESPLAERSWIRLKFLVTKK